MQCQANNLINLDVTQNPILEVLVCHWNEIVSLDLSQNLELRYLNCSSNQLTSLNLNNGNNINLPYMKAIANFSLECIKVDDENASFPSCNSSTGWCIESWMYYSEDCELGVIDFYYTNLSLYPNPVQNTLRIDSDISFDTINVYSFQGQLIKSTKRNEIDVSELSSGLYFVALNKDGQSITKVYKVLKLFQNF